MVRLFGEGRVALMETDGAEQQLGATTEGHLLKVIGQNHLISFPFECLSDNRTAYSIPFIPPLIPV